MVGLVIGIVRMVMDFAYPAPLCMEEDLRPSIVSQVRYILNMSYTGLKYNHRKYSLLVFFIHRNIKHRLKIIISLIFSFALLVSLHVLCNSSVLGHRNRGCNHQSSNTTWRRLHGNEHYIICGGV